MKKNLKKLSALLLALALSVSTTACGNSTASTTTAAENGKDADRYGDRSLRSRT